MIIFEDINTTGPKCCAEIKPRKMSDTQDNISTEEKSTNSQVELPYRILNQEKIDEAVKSKTEEIASEFKCSFDMARTLLITNNWDKKAIHEEMQKDVDYIKNTFNFDPKEAEARACGLKKEEEGTLTCGVCYDDCEQGDIVTIKECGHKACFECIQDYCKAKLQMGNDAIATQSGACPM